MYDNTPEMHPSPQPELRALMQDGCDAVRNILHHILDNREKDNNVFGTQNLNAWLETAAAVCFHVPLINMADNTGLTPSEAAVLLILYAFHEQDDIRDLCTIIRHHRLLSHPTHALLDTCIKIGCTFDSHFNRKRSIIQRLAS